MAAPPDQSQSLEDTITSLEASTWEALKKSSTDMIPYLSVDCVMIFPGTDILSEESDPTLHDILSRKDFKPWTSYKMRDVHVISLGQQAASITYNVKAERDDTTYRAFITSVWRDVGDGWRMVVHQQTVDEL